MAKSDKAPRWDLSDLYVGPTDKKIYADLAASEKDAAAFARRMRGQILGLAKKPAAIVRAIERYEAILERAGKPMAYAYLVYAEEPADPARGKLMADLQSRFVLVSQQLHFFEIELAEISLAAVKKLGAAGALGRYRHYLERVVASRPYRLSEIEEKLIEERNLTGREAFGRLFDQDHADIHYHVKIGGKTIHCSESKIFELLQDPVRSTRAAAAAALSDALSTRVKLYSYIFNTLLEDKRIEDKYRRWPEAESARHFSNDTTAEMVETMVQVVESGYPIVADYFKFKAKKLKIKDFVTYDRAAPMGKGKAKYSFAEAKSMVLTAFARFDPRYAALAEEFFARRWIEAEDRHGKRGGAFCSPAVPSVHPYVFMSYSGSLREVLTLAHELGHAIHFRLMQEGGYLNFNVPLTVAETASVFSEMLVFDLLRETITEPAERLALYSKKIESIFNTVFRQVSLYRFEQDFHGARRNHGELPVEAINELWAKRQRQMYRDSVRFLPEHHIWWSYIPHFIHSPFYVYAYAYGELLTLALYEQYRIGAKDFTKKYFDLLAAGAQKSPETLVKPLGFDLGSKEFWTGGLHTIKRLVKECKSLA